MKKLLLLITLSVVLFASCDKEDELQFDYQIEINSPDAEAKHLNDTMHIHTVFSSNKEAIIHHINVRIFNSNTLEVVYNKPDMAHLHDMDGHYEFHDNLVLSEENGFDGHTDWTIEAKVWGHEAGHEEVIGSVNFHVHPE